MTRTCAQCHFWDTPTPDTAVIAPCVLGKIPYPEFWQGCASFLDRERAAAEQGTMQSQVRGSAMPYWGSYISGVKP